jgi:glycine/D-amino acid oxidase-like deaminating enzyme
MTVKPNIIVVGNGLFGSIAATYARAAGYSVTVLSDKRPFSASPASGCVLAPSWLSSMPSGDIANALAVLKDLYTLHNVEFKTKLTGVFKAKRVNTDQVLIEPDVFCRVTRVEDGRVTYMDANRESHTLTGVVFVAAGIWCNQLIKDLPEVKGLYGASLRVPNTALTPPVLSVYAPYRQLVAFNITDSDVWCGDGSALVDKTWAAEREQRIVKLKERVVAATGMSVEQALVTEGARPYIKEHKAGYLQQVSPRLWVSTGGAKNGTALAAAQSYKFIKGLQS